MSEVQRKFVFYMDGLRYSFAMAALATTRLKAALDEIYFRIEKEECCEELIPAVMLDAWTIVDICYRVRQLIQQTPGLSQRLPEIQTFLHSTTQADKLRHYVQHLRSEISNASTSSSPVWGSLSWIPSFNKICHTIFTGNLLDGISVRSISYDREASRFTSELILEAGGIEIDLKEISDGLAKLKIFICAWIDLQPNMKRSNAKTPIIKFGPVSKGGQ
ncbi:MAG TPA: hypothetical protein VHC95_00875 [Opitutales bacterium]|nr:hypothetical protein [Opitutales bacterium]